MTDNEQYYPGMRSPAGYEYAYTETYDRSKTKIKNPTFYENPIFNPKIVESYNSSDNVIKLEYSWGGKVWTQTISGTGSFGDQTVTYTVTRFPWEIS